MSREHLVKHSPPVSDTHLLAVTASGTAEARPCASAPLPHGVPTAPWSRVQPSLPEPALLQWGRFMLLPKCGFHPINALPPPQPPRSAVPFVPDLHCDSMQLRALGVCVLVCPTLDSCPQSSGGWAGCVTHHGDIY